MVLSAILILALTGSIRAQTASITGRIIDATGLALPGVTVTVRSSATGSVTATTGEDGTFVFSGLPRGSYDLDASLEGFERIRRPDIAVGSKTVAVDLTLNVSAADVVTITEPAATPNVIGGVEPNAPVTVTRQVMDVAMLPNSQFDDVLTLMPNVQRGPDGLITIASARAESSALYVDGVNVSDPITGGAGLMLPLEAVDTTQVYAGGAPAEYGGASGGVATIQTASGGDRFQMRADSFFPRLLFANHGIGGVEYWDPNAGARGPIVRNRLWFQQAVSYRYDRNSFTTLAGDDHNLSTALLTWSEIEAQLTRRQYLRISLAGDPRDTDRANITAFTPGSSAPAVHQGGWTASVHDTITADTAVLQFHATTMRTGNAITPYGSDPYVVGHQLAEGSYFERHRRDGERIEGGATLSWTRPSGHQVTAGVSLDRVLLDQRIDAAPVTLLQSDGGVARTITFSPAAVSRTTSSDGSAFVQDNWTATSWLTLNAGVRLDDASAASRAVLSPRVAWTVQNAGGKTTVSGSAGWYSDVLPLDALSFATLPSRTVAVFSSAGEPLSSDTYVNQAISRLDLPRAVRWDVQVDRRLGSWQMRARYEDRSGTRELIVEPGLRNDAAGAPSIPVFLTNAGSSRSRSLEATAGLRVGGGTELYGSYVRSWTEGDTNTLAATEGLFRTPFVQPNQRGPLAIDVPHRLLAWSIIQLPGRFTVAPFLEARSGFPFTAIDDAWTNASAANAYRLPWMATLDLSVHRVVTLPRHLPDARIGLKLYNVASTHTGREVQRDITRADFGTLYDPIPRDFSIVFQFLWGTARRP